MVTVKVQHTERRTTSVLKVTAPGAEPVTLAPTEARGFALEPGQSLKITCQAPKKSAEPEPATAAAGEDDAA